MSDGISPGSALPPYPKIISKSRADTPNAREWTATEKVHGAHFALVCAPDGTVRPAKRRELLDDDELDAFFGVSRIWATLAVDAARCAASLRGTWGADAVITLYGELAGGHYPHPAVGEVAGAQAVQTGVWYSPDLGNRTDVNRDTLWPILGEFGMRPNRQIAIDEVWSALGFRALKPGEQPFTGGK